MGTAWDRIGIGILMPPYAAPSSASSVRHQAPRVAGDDGQSQDLRFRSNYGILNMRSQKCPRADSGTGAIARTMNAPWQSWKSHGCPPGKLILAGYCLPGWCETWTAA